MKRSIRIVLAALLAVGAAASYGVGQSPVAGKGDTALAQGAAARKTVCLVFYRDWDAAAAAMTQAVKSHADKNGNVAAWNVVPVAEASEKALVDRYQLGRAPMPMAVAFHPNGAVTGFFPGKVTEADLARTIVSPKKAECMKLLQDSQLVLLCVKNGADSSVPDGVAQFRADPMFASRTKVITANSADPVEAAFYSELKVAPGQTATVFMAPPGVLVGRFAATATKTELATALHAAGKCCDDKNCKHNH